MAMKASPCAKKLKKAAKNLKLKKKDKSDKKTTGLTTPSPKPILKSPTEVPGSWDHTYGVFGTQPHTQCDIYIYVYIDMYIISFIKFDYS